MLREYTIERNWKNQILIGGVYKHLQGLCAKQPNRKEDTMKFELTASMMCANYGNLEKEVRELEAGGIDSFHIDIIYQ